MLTQTQALRLRQPLLPRPAPVLPQGVLQQLLPQLERLPELLPVHRGQAQLLQRLRAAAGIRRGDRRQREREREREREPRRRKVRERQRERQPRQGRGGVRLRRPRERQPEPAGQREQHRGREREQERARRRGRQLQRERQHRAAGVGCPGRGPERGPGLLRGLYRERDREHECEREPERQLRQLLVAGPPELRIWGLLNKTRNGMTGVLLLFRFEWMDMYS